MAVIIVFNNPRLWPLHIPGVEVVGAADYLMAPRFVNERGLKVFNLCRSYRYQSTGYYVSLLAAARAHRAFPSISTIQEMKSPSVVQTMTDDLESLIGRSLAAIQSDTFELSIYFGQNVARKYAPLSVQIFNLFKAPLLRAFFVRKNRKWKLQSIRMISVNEIPDSHRPYVIQFAQEYFARRIHPVRRRSAAAYDLAILADNAESEPPSNAKAMRRFVAAARRVGFNVELLDRNDYSRLAEFDALFIRETTRVNHHTFRFAQKAEAEGLVVIDDPGSILKCTNKVYLAELLKHHRIPAPRTLILNAGNAETAGADLGFPLVLKQPDSSFSQGVVKVDTPNDLGRHTAALLDKSDLIVAQEFMPTEFDWRIGILDRHALFACKYFMADRHWQVLNWQRTGRRRYGRWETVVLDAVPPRVLRTALRAANLIGDGFYGVDVKCVGRKCFVIEVNDNPNVDAGVEDLLLGDELYLQVMNVLLARVRRKKEGRKR